jgi:hypothetical protein
MRAFGTSAGLAASREYKESPEPLRRSRRRGPDGFRNLFARDLRDAPEALIVSNLQARIAVVESLRLGSSAALKPLAAFFEGLFRSSPGGPI